MWRILRRPCGSRPAWSPPSLEPHPLDRSPVRLQRLNDGRDHIGVRPAASPDRDALNLDLNDASIRLGLASPRFARLAKSRCLSPPHPPPPARTVALRPWSLR